MEDAYQCLTQSREIERDFYRYASDQPFTDLEVVAASNLLARFREQTAREHPGLVVSAALKTDEDCFMETSVQAVLEVLEILVGNSIRHSQKRLEELLICLEISCADPDSSLNIQHLQLEYCDNGRGIAADMREELFQPFRTDHPEGTGLGLAIASQFVSRLGGTIKEEGSHGGARFIIRLPLRQHSTNT